MFEVQSETALYSYEKITAYIILSTVVDEKDLELLSNLHPQGKE